MNHPTRAALLAAVALTATGLTSCGGGSADSITLIAYDSFTSDPESPIGIALAEFTEQTGTEVEVVHAGDAGQMLAAASLTAGNPEGDVMWGVDNTFLSRALGAGVFDPYEADGLDSVPADLTDLVPGHEVTPVDFGDVCVNYDKDAIDSVGLAPPDGFAALAAPDFAGQLVVENPGTSSPGLAFLLATIAAYGQDGWEQYWAELRANDVLVVDSWDQAYYDEFSQTDGDRAMVVSYGTSPAAEVLFADPQPTDAPTGVIADTCFRQVEFAGVLRGTDAPDEARQLVDFLLSERFQQEIALSLFVFPANADVELPEEFTKFAVVPDDPLMIDPALIEADRAEWTDRWTAIMTR